MRKAPIKQRATAGSGGHTAVRVKLLIAAVGLISLSACIETSGLGTSPDSSLELMKGSGSLAVSQSGTTSFRFAIHKNAFNGLIASEQYEDARRDQLARYLAGTGQCSKGWTLDHQTEVKSAIIYEGRCK